MLFFLVAVQLEQVTWVSSKDHVHKRHFLLFPTPILHIGHLGVEACLFIVFLIIAFCFLRSCLLKPGPGFNSISPDSKISLNVATLLL